MAGPLDVYKEHLGTEMTQVATTTKVCFDDDCTLNAPGWVFEGHNIVFADDARGIPVKVGNCVVTEVNIEGAKEPVRSDER